MEKRISTKYQPIKDNAALHGRDIGYIGTGTRIVIDELQEHEGWVPIIGPEGLGPTWLKTGKQGWVKLANTNNEGNAHHTYLLELDEDGLVVSFRQIS